MTTRPSTSTASTLLAFACSRSSSDGSSGDCCERIRRFERNVVTDLIDEMEGRVGQSVREASAAFGVDVVLAAHHPHWSGPRAEEGAAVWLTVERTDPRSEHSSPCADAERQPRSMISFDAFRQGLRTAERVESDASGRSRRSAPERPCHHQRELFSPERAAVLSVSLDHGNVRVCIAQRIRPPRRVVEEELFLPARHEVDAGKRTRQYRRRLVAGAGRGTEDRAIDVRMAKPQGERELTAERRTPHASALGGQRDSETRLNPSTHVVDEELLVCCEPFSAEARHVLMKPAVVIWQPVDTTIIVGGALAPSRTTLRRGMCHAPSAANTTASAGAGGTYTVTWRPPSYSSASVTSSPAIGDIGVAP